MIAMQDSKNEGLIVGRKGILGWRICWLLLQAQAHTSSIACIPQQASTKHTLGQNSM